MANEEIKRKLTAILSADVKDYSRLMGQDEVFTIKTLTAHRELISSFIKQYKGRVVDTPGDNILAAFESVSNAVNCSAEIQRDLSERNAEVPSARMMQWRIGVNLGDVIEEDGRIYGDGVNIAARVEGICEPGGICISGTVYDQVQDKLGLEYESLGEQEVKNIAKPVRMYRVLSYPGAAAHRVVKARGDVTRRWHIATLGVAVAAMLCVGSVLIWSYFKKPEAPQVETAKTETATVPVRKAEASLQEKPRIAILPFENMSDDPGQGYFADGVVEEITAKLSMNSNLAVTSRKSAFSYKNKQASVTQIGKELGARYVVEGSVRKAGNMVRIIAQLIDATTDKHLWAETYNRDIEDVFAVQDEIAERVAASLNAEYTDAELKRVRRIPTDNLTAYDSYLRGISRFLDYGDWDWEDGLQWFKRAIKLDPDFADAYAYMGFVIAGLSLVGINTDPEVFQEGMEYARKAISIDNSVSQAHLALAQAYRLLQRYEEAMSEVDTAIRLNPSDSLAHTVKGAILRSTGRSEEAVGILLRSRQLDPVFPGWCLSELGVAYRNMGDYSKSIAAFKEALSLEPGQPMTYWELTNTYHQLGQYDEAIATVKEGIVRNIIWPWASHRLGTIQLDSGRYEEAMETADRELSSDDPDMRGAYEIKSRALTLQWVTQLAMDPQTLEKALEMARKAVTLGRDVWHGRLNLSFVYQQKAEYDDALAEAEAGIVLAPYMPLGSIVLGSTYNLIGRHEDAIALAEKMLGTNQKDVGVLAILGYAYRLTGRLEDALAINQQLLGLNPGLNSWVTRIELAILYSELGRKEEAKDEAAELLRILPHFSVDTWGERNPMKDRDQVNRDRAALRKAGLK